VGGNSSGASVSLIFPKSRDYSFDDNPVKKNIPRLTRLFTTRLRQSALLPQYCPWILSSKKIGLSGKY
jgi:hypothetical protein